MTPSMFDSIYPLRSLSTIDNIASQTEQQRKASFLNILAVALGVLLGISLVLMLVLSQVTLYSFLIVGTGFSVNIFSFYLNRIGKTQFAAYIFCFNFYAILAPYIPIRLLAEGNINNATSLSYVLSLSIILAGMLIHPRAPFGYAILNSLVIVISFSIGFDTVTEIVRAVFPILFFSYLLTIVSWLYQRSLAGTLRHLDQAHEKTKRSEAHYRQLIEVAQEGIWVLDTDSKTVLVNPSMAQMLGYTVDEMLDKHLFDFMDEQGVVIATHNIERRQQGITEQHDFEFICKDGKRIYTTIETAPLHDDAGNYRGAIAGIMDITERKLAEGKIRGLNEELEERVRLRTAELENANQELDAFAYSVSHDLRAPLRAITGFSQAVLEDYEDIIDEEGQDLLNDIVKSGKRMNDLIQDLLHLSRITRSDLHPREVNISDIVQSVLDELQSQDRQRQIIFSVEKNIKGHADERLLRVVFDNLLGNAWKFTGKTDNAQIDFFTIVEDGIIVYVVKDNGAGFDMAYADKLFGAFQRLHHDDEFEGTGIGLATVQRAIHKHRGRIWSDATIGQGATFYFTLPARM